MKHISMDYHFVCEQVQDQDGKLQVSHVSTKDQLAGWQASSLTCVNKRPTR